MNKQEVKKKFLEHCSNMAVNNMCADNDCADCEYYVAIECVEKQIPRKPNKVKCLNGKFAYLCPTCGGGLMSMCRCHYAECGQAILWESDNE